MGLTHVIVNIYVYIILYYNFIIVLNSLKNEVRYNVIISYKNDCSDKLIDYLSQFGNEDKYHLQLDTTDADPTTTITNKFNNLKSELDKKNLMIYNFITDKTLIAHINTEYKSILYDGNYNGLIHYGIEREYFYTNLNDFENLIIANEFLYPNKTNNEMSSKIGDTSTPLSTATPITTPTPVDMDKYTNSEILLYEMLEMLSKIFQKQSDIESNQVLFELFDKDLYGANMVYGLLKNMRIVADIMMGNVIKDTSGGSIVLYNLTAIPVRYLVPISQVQGQPLNTSCDVTFDNPIIDSDAIFIVLSFYGRNDRGYYDSHKLISLLAAIDLINENVYILIYNL